MACALTPHSLRRVSIRLPYGLSFRIGKITKLLTGIPLVTLRATDDPRHLRPILFRQNVGYLGYDFNWLHTLGVSAPRACSSFSLGGMTVSSDRDLPPAIRFNPSPHASRVSGTFPILVVIAQRGAQIASSRILAALRRRSSFEKESVLRTSRPFIDSN